MTIKPFGGRIIVKKIDAEKKESIGGIILPNNATKERVIRAEVMDIGTDKDLGVKIGDQIIISDSFTHVEVVEDEEKYLLIKPAEILAIIVEVSDA